MADLRPKQALDVLPMCGRAERTTGELLAARGLYRKGFLATKFWTSGREAGILLAHC